MRLNILHRLENRDTVITLEKSIKIIVSGDDVLRTQPPPPEVPPNQTPIVFLITCPPEKAEFGRRAFEDAYVLASTGRDYLQKTDNAYVLFPTYRLIGCR
jgi:hypothetical protein